MDGNRKPIIEIGKGINNNLNISNVNIIDMLKSKKEYIDNKNIWIIKRISNVWKINIKTFEVHILCLV